MQYVRLGDGPIAILGGAARAVIVALLERGAQEIRLLNRTFDKAAQLAREFGPSIRPIAWEQRDDAIADIALLANATPQGMAGNPPLAISLNKLSPRTVVSDLIYVPPETPLLASARARGNVTINGLGMLLHQARPAFQTWFGVMPDTTADLRDTIMATFRQ
jgi:shikimate dehydrogenase